ncbi:MAG: hypothetical protein IPG80_03460 [Anaerolineales bacterium]|uniref:hypothetical protein n=1 Tax=Candidatus Villigracilis vicinus TaxID=3140679 RepID=UPI0031349DB5|nr:hypothetical protein [Anaerolineales bacterium]
MMLAAAAAALTIRPNLLNIRFKPYSGDICRVPGYSTSGYIKVPCNNTCLVPGYNAPSGYIKVPCYTPTTPGYNTPTPGYNVPGYGR